jgi:hypothetical protein
LRGCNFGITGGKDLWITRLKWANVPWYTPSSINTDSAIQKLIGEGIHVHRQTQQDDLLSLLSFFSKYS